MGRDKDHLTIAAICGVSTHAPLWGATDRSPRRRPTRSCFNPRAPMGRDTTARSPRRCMLGFNPRAPMGRDRRGHRPFQHHHCFNPRAPMGRDRRDHVPAALFVKVSTHAPLWGATGRIIDAAAAVLVSTHAPLWGATPRVCKCDTGDLFQPTRPYGARRATGAAASSWAPCFNPRAPMGRDPHCRFHRPACGVSTHAPLWGATDRP